jgi:hypothetical protein
LLVVASCSTSYFLIGRTICVIYMVWYKSPLQYGHGHGQGTWLDRATLSKEADGAQREVTTLLGELDDDLSPCCVQLVMLQLTNDIQGKPVTVCKNGKESEALQSALLLLVAISRKPLMTEELFFSYYMLTLSLSETNGYVDECCFRLWLGNLTWTQSII